MISGAPVPDDAEQIAKQCAERGGTYGTKHDAQQYGDITDFIHAFINALVVYYNYERVH